MMGYNICFKEVIWKIIPKMSLLPFLSGVMTGHYTSPGKQSVTSQVTSLCKLFEDNNHFHMYLKRIVTPS